MMKKLLLAAIIALIVTASAVHAAEDCVATDYCMLYSDIKDFYYMATHSQQYSDDVLRFALNELAVAGKLIKPDRGTRMRVVAKKNALYQVLYNGKLYYTAGKSVKCK